MAKTGENKILKTKIREDTKLYSISTLHEGLINWVNFRLTKIIDNKLVRDELG